jgi:hypothetical protein
MIVVLLENIYLIFIIIIIATLSISRNIYYENLKKHEIERRLRMIAEIKASLNDNTLFPNN